MPRRNSALLLVGGTSADISDGLSGLWLRGCCPLCLVRWRSTSEMPDKTALVLGEALATSANQFCRKMKTAWTPCRKCTRCGEGYCSEQPHTKLFQLPENVTIRYQGGRRRKEEEGTEGIYRRPRQFVCDDLIRGLRRLQKSSRNSTMPRIARCHEIACELLCMSVPRATTHKNAVKQSNDIAVLFVRRSQNNARSNT